MNPLHPANTTQAKELLLLHSFSHPNLDHPKMATGFLGSLRPYRGLAEENFHEVMRSLAVLAPLLALPQVDREIVSAVWSICHLARDWGVNPGGMLQGNALISAEDVARLESWVEHISYATNALLDGVDVEVALDEYRQEYGN